jgi:Flp pilus assembly pilin Flp
MLKIIGRITKGQTAVEYMLLLGVVTAIVLGGFKYFIPKVNKSSELYYNEAARAILGTPPSNSPTEAVRTNYP